MKSLLNIFALFLFSGIAQSHESAVPGTQSSGMKVLAYSNTGYYRHPDIPALNRWLVLLGHENGFEVDVTEHWKDLQPEVLARYDVLVLNNANELDKVLPEAQRKAVEVWFTTGKKGIVGLHAALVHQKNWPWLNSLGGCDFNSDSDFAKAKVTVEPAAKEHPAVKGQPAEFWIEADWTNHDRSVAGLPGFQVLLRVDESTYTPVRDYFQTRGGKPMGADHPIAWTNEPASGGRFFYTEFGHDLRSLSTAFARQHVLEGIKWAAAAGKPASKPEK
jgi:type 1 glutamine amidotransferase